MANSSLTSSNLVNTLHSLMPARKLRVGAPLVLSALVAVALETVALLFLHPGHFGSVLSQSLQAICACLAGFACWKAGLRARQFSRFFWQLCAAAFFLWALAQIESTYRLYSVQGPVHSGAANIMLYFFSFTPLFAALFLSPRADSEGPRLEFLLDFLQVLIVTGALYLLFLHVPWWQLTQDQWVSRRAATVNVRNAALSLGFILRAFASRSRRERELYTRVGFPMVLYSLGFWLGKRGITYWSVRLGTWFDLGWSLPFLLIVLLAESWQDSSDVDVSASEMGLIPIALACIATLSLAGVTAGLQVYRGYITTPEVFLICGSAGAVVLCFFFRLGVTLYRQKKTFDLLQASEGRYRSLFERNLAGVFSTTPDGRYIDCNEAYAHMFGYSSRTEMLSCSPFVLYPNRAAREEQVALLRKLKTFTNLEAQRRRKDGSSIWVLHNVTLLHDEKGDEFIEGTVIDIDERKRLEEQLRQSQKMEAIGQLAGGIAHDFNNLLTVIKGYVRMILESHASDGDVRLFAEHIDSAAERAASLTRHLLAFSRKQVMQPKVIDLNSLISNLDKMLRRVIGEHIEMLTVPAKKIGPIKADPGQIEQVLMNLVVNARDAMPNGGKITVETADIFLDEQYTRDHEGLQPGPYVMLAVSDTGMGMDAATKSRIFEPFFTTKELGRGTGLGLSTVYGIVKQSGGHIWVYSEPGCGTTFKVYFSRVEETPEAIPRPQVFSGAVKGRETILVVEDDPAVRELTRSALTASGYSVIAAANGQEVSELCARNSESIQLLLTDVVMPGMNGRQVAEMVCARWPRIRVLFMSGYAENSIVHHGVLDTGIFFLPKPFTPSVLTSKVREVLDDKTTGS
ncbi:MAG TPA: ATP-binding protein [Candidatus Acidoferrum sp.]|nr:ATP-binding protein [Candidatus Acidoferrum sp.]